MKMCDFNPILEYIRNFHFQDDGKLTDDEIKEFHNLYYVSTH